MNQNNSNDEPTIIHGHHPYMGQTPPQFQPAQRPKTVVNPNKKKGGGVHPGVVAGIAGAGVLGTAGAAIAATHQGGDEDLEIKPEDLTDMAEVSLESASGSAPEATGVNDGMSFNEAFAAARAEVGAGGCFTWHGGVYGTYYATEWDAMSAEQKADYEASVFGNSGASNHSLHTDNTDSQQHVETHNYVSYNEHVEVHHHYYDDQPLAEDTPEEVHLEVDLAEEPIYEDPGTDFLVDPDPVTPDSEFGFDAPDIFDTPEA